MAKTQMLNDNQISVFCEQIYMVIHAGLPIHQGVSILLEDAKDTETKDFLQQIYEELEVGNSLHYSLEKTKSFPDYMIHMIQIGEETGKLEEVLHSLSEYYKRESEIKNSIRYAITYPSIMFFMILAVIVVLITKVLPIFSNIYKSLGTELSGFAHTLMNISIQLNRYLFVIVLVLIACAIVLFILYHVKKAKKLFQRNELSRGVAMSRFANCLYLATSSGLDTTRALELASELIDHPFLHDKIVRCKNDVLNGESFATSLFTAGIFPKMYTSWIDISFTTGEVESTMKNICKEYENETDRRISRMISVLEPVLVIILSVIVGIILISFLLPLLGIMAGIGN